MCLIFVFLLLLGLTSGRRPDSPSSTTSTANANLQYLVDISYRADGQLEFMPNTLQNVPAGAIILFTAPANAPFYLYETPYNTSQKLCASRTRMNGLTTSDGTTQIYIVAPGAEPMAHFACPMVASTCVCDGNSLFLLNPSSDTTRLNIRPVTISDAHETVNPKMASGGESSQVSKPTQSADKQPSDACN